MIFTCVYVASVVSRAYLRYGFSKDVKIKAQKEGYVLNKTNRRLSEKIKRFFKECFLTFVPGVNTLSALHYYFRSFNKYYDKVIENGLPYGKKNSSAHTKFEKEENREKTTEIKNTINDEKNKKSELRKAKIEALKEKRNLAKQARREAKEAAKEIYKQSYEENIKSLKLKK